MRILLCAMILSVISLAASFPCAAGTVDSGVDLNIEVFQALREGVRGTGSDGGYARIGLPFPKGMVKESNGRASLAVEEMDYQTRVLKRWPDGSVKWALVEFLASPGREKKQTVHLVSGTGVSAGPALAREKEGRIHVDTGPMQVEIRKGGFSLFDRVVVNGQDLLRPGKSRGIVLTDGSGKEFLASRCGDTRVVIEENGPVKATVRVDGSHCGEKGKLLDYTVRLFFVKGKSTVRTQYTLRNASRKSPRHVYIKSLGLETELGLGEGVKALVSTHTGEGELDLGKGPVNLYQAVSDFPWLSDGDSFYYNGPVAPDFSREQQRGYAQEGYWLRQGGKTVAEGKRSEFPDLGFMDVSDASGRGMTVGVRYMAGLWPKALKADSSGRVVVSLWPEENGRGHWIRYGSHTSFEVMFAFHSDSSVKPADEMNRFQYPLVARAPVDWYNRNVEGIYPLYHFISFSDEQKLAGKLGAGYSIGWRKPKLKVWRYHYWGHGAFLNQHDFARIALINGIRDDRDLVKAGESTLYAESVINYYADWAVYHSDDYDYSKEQFTPTENKAEAELAKVVFEWEHQHWYGMPLYYYMTGDERVREAILDWGEYVKRLANPLSLTYMRVFGTGMFSLAAMYEFTGDKEFLRLADMNFDRLLKVKYTPNNPPSTIFIDWDRGIVAGGSGSGWPSGVKVDVMMGSTLYDGLLNYYRYMGEGNPHQEGARKLLGKMSEFMLREPYFEGTKRGQWAYWLPYVYNLTDREKSDHSYKLIGQATFWTVFPFEETGETRWVEQMKKMMKMAMWDESGVWGSYSYLDHPGFQTIGYYLLNMRNPDNKE